MGDTAVGVFQAGAARVFSTAHCRVGRKRELTRTYNDAEKELSIHRLLLNRLLFSRRARRVCNSDNRGQ